MDFWALGMQGGNEGLNNFWLRKKDLSDEGATKYLWRLGDGETVESVLLEHENMICACVSSQVGCPLNCVFCATGQQDFVRDLTVKEMIAQIEGMADDLQNLELSSFDRILFMGMGEPLLNYNSVLKAIFLVRKTWPVSRILLATSGVVPRRIYQLARDAPFVKLWLSLPAPHDSLPRKLTSEAPSISPKALMNAGEYYARATQSVVRMNYIMIKGLTDSPSSARELVKLLKGKSFELQLSEFKSVPHLPKWNSPSTQHMYQFARFIDAQEIPTTVFRSKGKDVMGACGQLRGRLS